MTSKYQSNAAAGKPSPTIKAAALLILFSTGVFGTEAALRSLLLNELFDSRLDTRIYVCWGLGMGFAYGLGSALVMARWAARRWGVLATAVAPVALVTIGWAVSIRLVAMLGPLPAALAGLAVGAVIAYGLALALSRVSPSGLLLLIGVSSLTALVTLPLWLVVRPTLERAMPPSPRAPHVVLITVDTLRADALGAFREGRVLPAGLERAQTPVLDRLASRGYTFQNAATPLPKTPQAVASLMTGSYPPLHGLTDLTSVLEPAYLTLAEILRESGWRTHAVLTNNLIDRYSGVPQGFDRIDSTNGLRPEVKQLSLLRLAVLIEPRVVTYALDAFAATRNNAELAAAVTDRALSALATLDRGPTFLWVHYLDPHWPYSPPEPFWSANDPTPGESFTLYEDERRGLRKIGDIIHRNTMSPREVQRVNALYAGEVEYLDTEVGRLLARLADRPDAGNVLLILTSDHGESLGEHDYFFSHGDLVYEPSMRVPLIIRPPGRIPEPARVEEPVNLVDIMPTVLDLVGLESPELVQGESLAPLMQSARVSSSRRFARRPIYGASDLSYLPQNGLLTIPGEAGKLRSIREGDWKLIRVPRDHENARRFDPELVEHANRPVNPLGLREATRLGPDRPDLHLLFDLARDPGEIADLSDVHPDRVREMNASLDQWLGEYLSHHGSHRKMDESFYEQLRTLGYTQ